jgi:hypothetical protein
MPASAPGPERTSTVRRGGGAEGSHEHGAEREAERRAMALSLKASMERWGGKAKTVASSAALLAILEGCGVRTDIVIGMESDPRAKAVELERDRRDATWANEMSERRRRGDGTTDHQKTQGLRQMVEDTKGIVDVLTGLSGRSKGGADADRQARR